MIKLRLPTLAPLTSPYRAKSTVWNWHFDEEKKIWINTKDQNGIGEHKGYDFSCPVGTPIMACAEGRIVKIGWDSGKEPPSAIGFGLRIIQVVHQDKQDWLVYYGHLSDISVKKDELIKAGQLLGKSGNTGRSTGAHLHCEARDPLTQQPQEIAWEV